MGELPKKVNEFAVGAKDFINRLNKATNYLYWAINKVYVQMVKFKLIFDPSILRFTSLTKLFTGNLLIDFSIRIFEIRLYLPLERFGIIKSKVKVVNLYYFYLILVHRLDPLFQH